MMKDLRGNVGVAVALLLVVFSPIVAHASSCAELVRLQIPDTKITSASEVAAGPFTPPGSPITLQMKAFCRVVAVAKPSTDSLIHFEVWIPSGKQWNGKFEGVGNGGFIGEISYGSMANAVYRGFATASSDTGHDGSEPMGSRASQPALYPGDTMAFGNGHPEKIADWSYRAMHVTTVAAKRIIQEYTGVAPKYSYFNGCSTGGHQALTEAQRFPEDYDGVIAGAPGNNRVHLTVGFMWAYAVTHTPDGQPILPVSKLTLINKAAVAACDAADGIKDGIIGDPESCHFDPGTLLCKGKETDDCLTAAQVEAVKNVYAGPRNPRTGEQIIAGYMPGSENAPGDQYGGWKKFVVDLKQPARLELWRDWVFNDPSWDWHTFDYDRDVALGDKKLAMLNAVNPDLSAFKSRGGKVLMYSGWADPIGPPMDAVNYYQRVVQAMGGRQQTRDFFRLFMVPGMCHCNGGPGTTVFGGADASNDPNDVPPQINIDPEHDVLSAMERWVEKGVAPDSIITAHVAKGDTIDRTRLACPYPQMPRWKGTGSTDEASNFVCADKPSTLR
ncbi:MAG: tannase/feruloyl esterase family alpha/beta hydrolase [Terriglobales bacterium]|jgi:feruloyl esterase